MKNTYVATITVAVLIAISNSYSNSYAADPAIPSGYNKTMPSNSNAEQQMKDLEKDPTFGSSKAASSDTSKASKEPKETKTKSFWEKLKFW